MLLRYPTGALLKSTLLGTPLWFLAVWLSLPAFGQDTSAFRILVTYEQILEQYRSLTPLFGSDSLGVDQGIEIPGFVVDETQTRVGREFYDAFYQIWQAPEGIYNFSVVVQEFPSIGRGTIVAVKVDDSLVFQNQLQPGQEAIEGAAYQAVQYVLQALTQSAFGPAVY